MRPLAHPDGRLILEITIHLEMRDISAEPDFVFAVSSRASWVSESRGSSQRTQRKRHKEHDEAGGPAAPAGKTLSG
jgi:hypothetical protein